MQNLNEAAVKEEALATKFWSIGWLRKSSQIWRKQKEARCGQREMTMQDVEAIYKGEEYTRIRERRQRALDRKIRVHGELLEIRRESRPE